MCYLPSIPRGALLRHHTSLASSKTATTRCLSRHKQSPSTCREVRPLAANQPPSWRAMENCTPKTKKRTRTEADEMQCKRRKCHWKHDGFVSEPMGDKDVTKLPGISKANGCKLRHLGCHSAYIVWAKFLVLGKDPVLFQCWLHDMTDASLPDTQACCDCLMEYTLVFGVYPQAWLCDRFGAQARCIPPLKIPALTCSLPYACRWS